MCDAQFPGSHLCHASEYVLSQSLTVPPASGAWIDPSETPQGSTTYSGAPSFGRSMSGSDCNSWTNATSSYFAPHVDANGGISNSGNCTSARALACCNGESKTQFVGVTSNLASMTGRVGMHQACDAQFPGSHFCHAAEYVRAASPTTIPAAGAWIDPSVQFGGSSTYGGAPTSGRSLSGSDCNSWTNTTSSYFAPHVDANGGISNSGNCTAQRYIACCL